MSKESLAVYKYLTYGNQEDIDPDTDYSEYGLTTFTPVFIVKLRKGNWIYSVEGFFNYIWDNLEVKPNIPKEEFDIWRGNAGEYLYIQDKTLKNP